MERTAIVTGLTGQDGSYLADLLLEQGYKVYGLKRRNSSDDLGCAKHLEKTVEIVEGDLCDLPSLTKLCKMAKADEFYNMAAQSHVATSFTQPVCTAEVTGLGVLHCLEAIRESGIHTRFLQASTSELFGGTCTESASEDGMNLDNSPFHPRSPYACAKLYGYWITVNYRESYRMYAVNSVAFNHESPRRGPKFVTRKIAIAAARIRAGLQDELWLGNIDARRDWGHAMDYVHGMHLMLQQPRAGDYVLATGEAHSVRDFCRIAFERAELGDYKQYVKIDQSLWRPADVEYLRGDASNMLTIGWRPRVTFEDLVHEMVDTELANVTEREVGAPAGGMT